MTIYAIALATNLNRTKNLKSAIERIKQWGCCEFSSVYVIPCRDQVGADYWNCACLLDSDRDIEQVYYDLKKIEDDAERQRPSHSISMDVDLIAWGNTLSEMHFNQKKMPLADDVVIPLAEIWFNQDFKIITHSFPSYLIHSL